MKECQKNSRKRILTAAFVMFLAAGTVYLVFPVFAEHQAAAYLTAHDPERAHQWLKRISRIRPLTIDEKTLLLRAHRKRSDLDGFSETAASLESDGEDEIVARQKILLVAQSGDISNIENRMLALLQDPRDEGADICEAIANGYVRNYQIEKAEPVLQTWRREFPQDPQAMVILGRVEEHRGDWEKALGFYKQALERAPDFGPAAYNAARVLLKQKKPEETLAYYDIVDDWSIDPTPAAVGRAHALRMMKKADEARKILLPLTQSDADTETRTRAFRLLGETGLAASTSIYSELGQIEFAAENFDDASQWLTKAVEGNPTDHTLRYLLARALVACGRKEEAKPHFEAYQESFVATQRLDKLMDKIRTTPNDPLIRCEMGELFLEHVSESQGVVWLNSALQIDPDLKRAHEALAGFFEEKLRSDPENLAYQRRLERHRAAIENQ